MGWWLSRTKIKTPPDPRKLMFKADVRFRRVVSTRRPTRLLLQCLLAAGLSVALTQSWLRRLPASSEGRSPAPGVERSVWPLTLPSCPSYSEPVPVQIGAPRLGSWVATPNAAGADDESDLRSISCSSFLLTSHQLSLLK